MSKRQKIIISITGITLVLLILVGLTYAYFLTRIQGNTNEKSISTTTANLKLVYRDGKPEVIEKENIKPSEIIGTKEFTVTNEGDTETEYVVVLDDVVIQNKTTHTSTVFNSNDFVYELTCTSSVTSSTCKGTNEESVLPIMLNDSVSNDGILVGNKIAKGETQSYSLTVKYKETGLDQSDDMNKTFQAKVDIKDIKSINPYEEGTLAYNIINNAKLKKNGTELKAIPLTEPARETSTEDEAELSYISDDYGPSYYFRGNVKDNYVTFANMCWRILRVLGTGDIKLVLASEKGECTEENVTTTSAYINDVEKFKYSDKSGLNLESVMYEKSILKQKLEEWYREKFEEQIFDVTNNVIEAEWCNDYRLMGYYRNDGGHEFELFGESWISTKSLYSFPLNLKCGQGSSSQNHNINFNPEKYGSGGAELIKSKIGSLTSLEVKFAGNDDTAWLNVQDNLTNGSWTITPANYFGQPRGLYMYVLIGGMASSYSNRGVNAEGYLSQSWSARPSIVLKSTATISDNSNGTLEHPYVINNE